MRDYYFNYVYRTTNILNGKYYIGMHSTSKLRDGYLGSGTKLKLDITKYGKEVFVKEILKHFPTREEASEYEIELTKLHYKNPMCYNMEVAARVEYEKKR